MVVFPARVLDKPHFSVQQVRFCSKNSSGQFSDHVRASKVSTRKPRDIQKDFILALVASLIHLLWCLFERSNHGTKFKFSYLVLVTAVEAKLNIFQNVLNFLFVICKVFCRRLMSKMAVDAPSSAKCPLVNESRTVDLHSQVGSEKFVTMDIWYDVKSKASWRTKSFEMGAKSSSQLAVEYLSIPGNSSWPASDGPNSKTRTSLSFAWSGHIFSGCLANFCKKENRRKLKTQID